MNRTHCLQEEKAYVSSLEFGISNTTVDYALGHSSSELDRLSFQGTVFAPYTRQLFKEAGLATGMRVLDVGSGSGDVSFLALTKSVQTDPCLASIGLWPQSREPEQEQ